MITSHRLLAQEINLVAPAAQQGLPNAGVTVGEFISTVLSAVLVIAALLLLMMLIWGAIEYINSGGEKGKIEAARNKMTQSVIGMIVLAATLAIFMLVQAFLNVDIISFGPGGG